MSSVGSFFLGAAASFGAWYALENKLVDIPDQINQFQDGRMSSLNNWQLAAAVGALVFLGFLTLSLLFSGGETPAPTKSKKKKKKSKASGAKGPKAKKSGAKTATKVEEKVEEEKPKSKKGKKKAAKAAKAAVAASQPKPKPKKAKKKAIKDVTNAWALLNDSEDESSDDGAAFSSPKAEVGMSKAASRRRRQAQNKEASRQQQQQPNANKPDEDGWTTFQVKRRTKRSGGGSARGVQQVQDQPQAQASASGHSAEVNVPFAKYGFIIGPKGATLLKLQEATDTRIDVPKQDSNKSTVTITGTSKDGVNRCKTAIQSLVKQGFCSITDPGKMAAYIQVEPRLIGVVIGPGGSNIKKLNEALDVRINTPDRNSESNKVTIAGEKENVRKAKEAIRMIMDLGYSPITHPGYVREFIDFPPNEYHQLIGAGGQTIKSIQGDTKTKIIIPSPNSDEDKVAIVGQAADVQRAKIQIDRLLDEQYQQAKAAKKGKGVTEEKDEFDW